MKIDVLSNFNVIPKGALDNSTRYVSSQTTEKPEPDVMEKIREENKGARLDVTA
ncbi:MAG TPA: hypothetical protein PK926_12715 [Spirochaetota bacterium]|nr:hypothetical protein [Spirochaetota bacterium]HPI91044.1 hypothetical protein [Spirochaetota bacterium]HPR49080.1 hypothetical protein [Spirochaetota bacterium]